MGLSFPSHYTLLLIENIPIICQLLWLGYVYALTLFYDKQTCLHCTLVDICCHRERHRRVWQDHLSNVSAFTQQWCSKTSHIIHISHERNTEYIWSLWSIMHMLLLFHCQCIQVFSSRSRRPKINC